MNEKGPVVETDNEGIVEVSNKFQCFIIFVDDKNQIHHAVGYQDIPKVSALKYLFEEIKADKDFAIPNIDEMRVDILGKEEFASIYKKTKEQKSE